MMKRIQASVAALVALLLVVSSAYGIQEFTLDEAQTRIERLEARVLSLENQIDRLKQGEVSAEPSHELNGLVFVDPDPDAYNGNRPPCIAVNPWGSGSFPLLTVTVESKDGTLRRATTLSEGYPQRVIMDSGDIGTFCMMTFTFKDLPNYDVYYIRFGTYYEVEITREELERMKWYWEVYL